jgi:hypothetical protein
MSLTLVLNYGQYPTQAIAAFTLKNLLHLHNHINQKVLENSDIVICKGMLDKIKSFVQDCNFPSFRDSGKEAFFHFEKMNKHEKIVLESVKRTEVYFNQYALSSS